MTRRMKGALSDRITQCQRCKAPIVWATTVASETGRGGQSMPLDAMPDPEGNVAVRPVIGGRLFARVLRKDEDHDRNAEKRAMPHFATCHKYAAEAAVPSVIEGFEDLLKKEAGEQS